MSSSAPMASQVRVNVRMMRTRREIWLASPDVFSMASCMSRRPRRRRTMSVKPVVSVMMPRPPTWMSIRMTAWPKSFQWVQVSNATRPVTHVAETVVNSESTKDVGCPLRAAMGSMSSTVPMTITSRKLDTNSRTGAMVLNFLFSSKADIREYTCSFCLPRGAVQRREPPEKSLFSASSRSSRMARGSPST